MTKYPLSPLTHCIRVNSILVHIENGGGVRDTVTKEKVRGAIAHKAGSKIPACQTISPVYELY
jgi:hypothetical protein